MQIVELTRYKPNLHCFDSIEDLRAVYPDATDDQIDTIQVEQGARDNSDLDVDQMMAEAERIKADAVRKAAEAREQVSR